MIQRGIEKRSCILSPASDFMLHVSSSVVDVCGRVFWDSIIHPSILSKSSFLQWIPHHSNLTSKASDLSTGALRQKWFHCVDLKVLKVWMFLLKSSSSLIFSLTRVWNERQMGIILEQNEQVCIILFSQRRIDNPDTPMWHCWKKDVSFKIKFMRHFLSSCGVKLWVQCSSSILKLKASFVMFTLPFKDDLYSTMPILFKLLVKEHRFNYITYKYSWWNSFDWSMIWSWIMCISELWLLPISAPQTFDI